MNLSRFFMNGVSFPFVSGSSETCDSVNASTRRFGGVTTPTGTLMMTVAFGVNDVPGIRPVTSYEPGFATALLSVGDGQITRTSGPGFPSRYTAGTSIGSRGIVPTTVSTVTSGTWVICEASG